MLPCRLKGELHALAEALATGADLYADERLTKHSLWAEELKTHYSFTQENAMDILLQETGRVFCQVLGDAGVFPDTPTGRTQFLRFVQEVR